MVGLLAEVLKYLLLELGKQNTGDKSRVFGSNEIIYRPTQKVQGKELKDLNSVEDMNE